MKEYYFVFAGEAMILDLVSYQIELRMCFMYLQGWVKLFGILLYTVKKGKKKTFLSTVNPHK